MTQRVKGTGLFRKRFIPSLTAMSIQSAQVNNDYERNISWLNSVGDFFRQLESKVQGNGSYAAWNGDSLFQF